MVGQFGDARVDPGAGTVGSSGEIRVFAIEILEGDGKEVHKLDFRRCQWARRRAAQVDVALRIDADGPLVDERGDTGAEVGPFAEAPCRHHRFDFRPVTPVRHFRRMASAHADRLTYRCGDEDVDQAEEEKQVIEAVCGDFGRLRGVDFLDAAAAENHQHAAVVCEIQDIHHC